MSAAMTLGWDVIEQDEDPPVQVVPTVQWPSGVQHILDDNCWCKPYRDGAESRLLIHREEGRA